MLEAQAHRMLVAGKAEPTLSISKGDLDLSLKHEMANMPYLYRNPCI
jgi:hypothetical protein